MRALHDRRVTPQLPDLPSPLYCCPRSSIVTSFTTTTIILLRVTFGSVVGELSCRIVQTTGRVRLQMQRAVHGGAVREPFFELLCDESLRHRLCLARAVVLLSVTDSFIDFFRFLAFLFTGIACKRLIF